MTNPLYDPYSVLLAVYGDGAHLKEALAETPIEELHRQRTVRVAYGVLEEDGYLSACIRAFAPKSPKLPIRVLLKVALYFLLFLRKQRYMVTDHAVALCKKLGKGGAAGFVNAFLRAFDESKVSFPAGDEGLALRFGYPRFVVDRLRAQYGDRTEAILAARSHGVTVRFERGEEGYLDREHEATPFPHTYIFRNFARDSGFFAGDYTFQSVGSIAICSVVERHASLLDACAAPGGKSVLLAKRCGRVTACELYPHRVALIEQYAARMGAANVTALQKDSSVFDPAYEGAFDGVLCDVPCSGLGTVAENPDLKLRKTEAGLAALQQTQRAILNNCARYLRAGGSLYYATCSVLEEENDGIVRSFCAESGFHPVRIDSPLPYERTAYGLQFLPDTAYGAGFYVARLER